MRKQIGTSLKQIPAIFKSMVNKGLQTAFDRLTINEDSFHENKEEVRYWKNQIFYLSLFVILILGTPLMLYGAYLFYHQGTILFGMIQAGTYLVSILFLMIWSIPIGIRKLYFVLMMYAYSIFLLFSASIMGSGMTCIIFTLVLSGCVLEKKPLLLFLNFNYVFFIILTLLLYQGSFDGSRMEAYKDIWVINAATAQSCSVLLLVLMNVIFNGLERQASLIKQSQKSLEASETKHKEMIKNIADAILIVDPEGRVLYHSPNLYQRFPWMSRKLMRNSFLQEFPSETREDFKAVLTELLDKPGTSSTILLRYQKEQETGYLDLTATNLLEDENIRGILINCSDATERKQHEEKIMFLYQHDYLTGLYNRVSYESELQRLDHSGFLPLSVVVGDINGLKMINDSLGHAEGDKLLIAMGQILKNCCREGDFIARLGGDEFTILMPHTRNEEANTYIQTIYDACEEYNRSITGEIYHISISLGAATKTVNEEALSTIIKTAEDYMYKRKLLEGRSFHSSVIASAKTVLVEKSFETEQHAQRLVHLSRAVGEAIGLTSQQFDELELFATLHDIGKIGVDNQILNKADKLTEEEWIKMKKHSEIGYRIAMASPELMSISYYILTHHEWWDGNGYPQGLTGEKIPLLSRILAIVDAYDAMTADRPYRKGMPKQEAITEITNNAGTQFDPNLVRYFVPIILRGIEENAMQNNQIPG